MAITLSATAITLNDTSTLVSTTTHLAIGSYATLAMNQQSGTLAVGATVAGTSLNYNVGQKMQQNGSFPAYLSSAGTAASGTWRNMSGHVNNSKQNDGENNQYFSHPCLSARVS